MHKSSNNILVTDVGSTTTKALLVSKEKGDWNLAGSFDVPTTVEKPTEDVKIGIMQAVNELQKVTRVKLLDSKGKIAVPYLSTSSAGGGLQILVFGLSATETGKVAQMTAYGAGGVILKTFTIDDLIPAVDKMRLIRELHPDMVLMAGGLDHGAIAGVVSLAEILALSSPEPKFKQSERIPLVFCGNVDAREFTFEVLKDVFDVHIVENVRPSTDELNIGPAKAKVHELFMENVMERAPGYAELKRWVSADILPTPEGVENILRLYAGERKENVLMVDMGGATTDIFSNIAGDYHRTVAANIGMSFSVSNILKQTGIARIMRHLPEGYDELQVRDYIAQKTLNPTYVPLTEAERLMEQTIAIEGIDVAWRQHREMNFKIARLGWLDRRKKITGYNKFEDLFFSTSERYFQLSDIDLIIGAGGIFAHVASKDEAFWMLAEGFKPRGITKLTIDRNFKSPHLGALAQVEPKAALALFKGQCLEELGYLVAPTGEIRKDKAVLEVRDARQDSSWTVKGGELLYLKNGGEFDIKLIGNICISNSKKELNFATKLPVLFDCRGRTEGTIKKAIMMERPLAKAGIPEFTFEPRDFKVGIESSRPEIRKGGFEIERRLPYEGDILVRKGDEVAPDTIIGENKYAPPKLYVFDLNRLMGYPNKLAESQIKEGLAVKVGDKVDMGQLMFKYKPQGSLVYSHYRAPLRGRITRIDRHGMIMMREIQDYDSRPHVVDIAKKLDVKPEHIKAYLKFELGDYIEADRIIAQKMEPSVTSCKSYEKIFSGTALLIKSPITGFLRNIDTKKGTVTIQYDLEPISLRSFVKGKVSKVKEGYAVRIQGKGAIAYGIIGFGGEVYGQLAILKDHSALNSSHKGKIAVTTVPIDEAFLRKAVSLEVAGIVAPSIHNADWVRFYGEELGVALTGDEHIPFTLILTEGFGSFEMNKTYMDFFKKSEGKLASLSGRTQIRAGVTRPMVIVAQ